MLTRKLQKLLFTIIIEVRCIQEITDRKKKFKTCHSQGEILTVLNIFFFTDLKSSQPMSRNICKAIDLGSYLLSPFWSRFKKK